MIKDRNELILQFATEGFWDWDLITNTVFLSPRYLALLGNPPGKNTCDSTTLFSSIHPEDRDRISGEMQEHLCGRRPSSFLEYRMLDSTGSYRWIEGRGSIVERDTIGKPIRVVGTITDITARREAEEKLRLSEKKFYEAFHCSPDSININRLNDGIYLEVNEGFTAMSGYSPEEVIGKSSLELDIWAVPQDRERLVREISEHGCCTGLETTFRRKDGTLLTGSMSARCIEINGVPCILNTTRDISEHKYEEDRIRKSEALLRCIIDSVGDIIYVKDIRGVYQACNKAGVEYIGLPESEQIGKTDYDLFSQEQADAIRAVDRQILAAGHAVQTEEHITKPDGSSALLETTKTPFYNSTGELLGIVGVSRDITVKKQSEENLKNSNKLLQTIINTVPVRVFWKDRDSRYLGCNRAFARDAGVDEPEELLGRDDFQLNWRDQAPAYRDDDRHVIESGESKISYDEPQTTPDGGQIWLRTSKVPLRNDSDEIFGVLGIYEDITQCKQMESENTRLLLQKKAILDNLPMMAWLKDCDSRLIMVNEPYAKACGKTIDECIGRTDLDLFPEAMAREYLADDREVCRTGEKKQVEEAITTPNGTKWHLTFKTPIRDENGIIIGTAGIAQDITDRRMAEDIIRESEKKYRLLSENVADVIWSIDLQTMRFKYVSPSMEKLRGVTQMDAMNENLAEIMTPESCQVAQIMLRDAIERCTNNDGPVQIQTYQFDMIHRNGTVIPTETVTTLINDQNQGISELIGVTRDISERIKAEQALLSSEERHRTLLKSVMDGFMVVGKDEQIVAVNETYCRMSGYTEQELLALRIHDIAIDETPETVDEVTLVLMKQGECRFESRHRRKDGSVFDVEVSIQYNHDTGEGISIIRDISDRKQADNAIRLSEERHRSILRTSMDGFWMMDTRGKFLEVNDTICRMLGYTEQELLAARIADIEAAESPEAVAAHFRKITANGEDRFESRLRHKAGSLIDVEVSVQFRPIEEGRFVAFLRDISARKKADEELQKKNADMEQFTYKVSHDLRSPLVTMKTFLGYLEEDMASSNGERVTQDLQFIHTAADKMKTLLDELLELSRIDRVDGEPEQISLREVFDEVLGSLAGSIDEHGAEIMFPEYDVTLFGDRRRLCQIWQNLIENAIKYRSTQQTPRIELAVREEHDEIIFCVRDNGIGIEPNYHEKIFGIFEKLDPASPGAGLGLSMLKRIVNKSGGTIWVESAGAGKGSCFCFTLPGAVVAR